MQQGLFDSRLNGYNGYQAAFNRIADIVHLNQQFLIRPDQSLTA